MSISRRMTLLACALLLAPASLWGQGGDFLGRSPEEWARQLKDRQPGPRRAAAFALGQIGLGAREYLPQLLELATSDDTPTVRERAAVALGNVVLQLKEDAREKWADLGPALERQLNKETDAKARRGLLYALGSFGPAAAPALPGLLTALADKNPTVRQNAAWAVGKLGAGASKAGVAEVCKLLQDENAAVRRDAANALGDIGLPTAESAVEPMLNLIDREGKKDGDPVVLKAALEKMVRLVGGRPACKITDKVLDVLRGKMVPEAVLARLKPMKDKQLDQEPFLEELNKVLIKSDVEAGLPEWLVEHATCDRCEQWADRFYPYLKNDDVETARAAAYALANIGGAGSRPAIPVLTECLRDEEDPELQEQAAAALGHIGSYAADAVAPLARTLSSKVPLVRRNCVVALSQIGAASEPAIPQLIKALQSDTEKDPEVRRYAALAFFYIGKEPNEKAIEKAIPAIVEVIRKDPDRQLRHACIDALFNAPDIKAHRAYDTLMSVTEEKEPETLGMRYEAARVLAFKLKESVPDKIPRMLLEALKNPNFLLFKGTNTRVEGAGEDRPTQPSVKDNTGGDARYLAAMALGWMGKTSDQPDIVAELEKCTKEKDPDLAQAATKALKLIKGK